MSKIYVPRSENKNLDFASAISENKLFKHDGSTRISSDIDWNNKKIVNLKNSAEDHSAVNKGYVDAEFVSNHDFRTSSEADKVFITKGLSISIVPRYHLVEYNTSNKKITSINDIARDIRLTPNAADAEIYLHNGRLGNYISFNKAYLVGNVNSDHFSTEDTTFFLVTQLPYLGNEDCVNFGWTKTDDVQSRYQTRFIHGDTFSVDFGNGVMDEGRMTRSLTQAKIESMKTETVIVSYKKDGSTGKMYIDGERVSIADSLNAELPRDADGEFQIGKGMSGVIYELHIYNRALNDDEMEYMHNYFAGKYGDAANVKYKRLTNVQEPIDRDDAVTKSYLESNTFSKAESDDKYLTKILAGNLDLNGHSVTNSAGPVLASDLVTKNYVDSTFMKPKARANLKMNNHRITQLGNPKWPTDAVNRQYANEHYVEYDSTIDVSAPDQILSSTIARRLSADHDVSIYMEFSTTELPSSDAFIFKCSTLNNGTGVFITAEGKIEIIHIKDSRTWEKVSLDFQANEANKLLICYSKSSGALTILRTTEDRAINTRDYVGDIPQVVNLFPSGEGSTGVKGVPSNFAVNDVLVFHRNLAESTVDCSRKRLTNLSDPVHGDDAVNKRYVVAKAKVYVSVHAEAKGVLSSDNEAPFNFGNGADGHGECGYTCLADGRVTRLGVSSVKSGHNPIDAVIVALLKNGTVTVHRVTKPSGETSGSIVLDSPLEFRRNDVLNFKSVSNNDQAAQTVVCALLQYDL